MITFDDYIDDKNDIIEQSRMGESITKVIDLFTYGCISNFSQPIPTLWLTYMIFLWSCIGNDRMHEVQFF